MNLGNLFATLDLITAPFVTGCQVASRAAQQMSSNVNSSISRMADESKKAQRDIGNLDVALKAIGRGFVSSVIVGALYEIGKSAIMASVQMQALEVQFKAVFGSAKAGAREWQDIVEISQRWGLDLRQTSDDYAKFMAAANLSTIAGEKAKNAFEGISIGITGLHLSSEKASRIFLQLQQMLSKGKVQAEELRVIAESLPGTYGLMAEALGITGQELAMRMRKGTQSASELVEKLGETLKKTYGEAALEGATKGQAAINNFNTELFKTKAALGDALMPAFKLVLDQLKFGLEGIKIELSWLQKGFNFLAAAVDATVTQISIAFKTAFKRDSARLFYEEWSKENARITQQLKESNEDVDKKLGINQPKITKTQAEIDAENAANKAREAQASAYRRSLVNQEVANQMGPKIESILSKLESFRESQEAALTTKSGTVLEGELAKITKQYEALNREAQKHVKIKVSIAGVGTQTIDTSAAQQDKTLLDKIAKAEDRDKATAVKGVFAKFDKDRKEYLNQLDDKLIAVSAAEDESSLQIKINKIPSILNEKFKDQIAVFDKFGDKYKDQADKFWKEYYEAYDTYEETYNQEFLNRVNKSASDNLEKANVVLDEIISTTNMNNLDASIAKIGLSIDKMFAPYMSDLDKLGNKASNVTKTIKELKEVSKFSAIFSRVGEISKNQMDEAEKLSIENASINRKTDFAISLNTGSANISDKLLLNDKYEEQIIKYALDIKELTKARDDLILSGASESKIAQLDEKIKGIQNRAKGLAQAEFKLFKDGELEATIYNLKKVSDMAVVARDIATDMTGPLADAFERFARTGNFAAGQLAQSLLQTLQVYAAEKTAMLLMEAAYQGVLGSIDYLTWQPAMGTGHFAAAAEALAGAAMMGSFVLGSGLAGMAHSGITNIPEDGTWLLKKNERVIDDKTNADLKDFLSSGGSNNQTINMPVTINGGDQQSVLKALPELKKTIIDAVTSNIASNGQIRKTIQQYSK